MRAERPIELREAPGASKNIGEGGDLSTELVELSDGFRGTKVGRSSLLLTRPDGCLRAVRSACLDPAARPPKVGRDDKRASSDRTFGGGRPHGHQTTLTYLPKWRLIVKTQTDVSTSEADSVADEEELEMSDLRDEEIVFVTESELPLSEDEYRRDAALVQALARQPGPARCSFCGKGMEQVAHMIEGIGACICDECVALCSKIVAEEAAKRASSEVTSD